MRNFLVLFLFFLCVVAHAEESDGSAGAANATISAETDFGTTQLTQQLSGSGSFGGSEKQEAPWSWSLGYSYEKSITPNAGSADIIDLTNSVNGGAGWNGTSGWGLNVALSYSNTAAESLVSRGSTLTLSHLWKATDGGDEFVPTFTLSFLGGRNTFAEYYTGTIPPRTAKAKARPTSGTVDLQQFLVGLDMDWVPLEAWDFDLGLKVFPYSHNPGDFQSFLDSSRSLSTGIGGFSGTIGGLPNSSLTNEIKWHFTGDWTNDFYASISILAVGYALDTEIKDTLDYKLSNFWKLTGGAEYQTSPSATYWVGILGLAFNF